MKEHQQSYEKIEPHESSSGLSDDANLDAFELRIQRLKTNHHKIRRLLIANVIILCLSVAVLLAAKFYSTPSTKQFVEKFSSYSPAREAVKYVSGTFNATQGEASGYVGTSNETEEMWDWVTRDIGDQMITTEELKLINKPEDSLKTKDPKSGKEGYRVGLEVFHQLHCLNMIRKSTFREFYDGKGDFAEKDDGKIRTHLNHCLEMLRMNIMCQVDIGVITFHDQPDNPGDPWPDFSTNHVCRDFDAVRKWAIDNTVAYDNI